MSGAGSWCAVATSSDLVPRHVYETELHGVELALWRDDDGCVNAWDNRCCHRSARLSLGINKGRRLRCQYHGWEYRSGDGQCVVLPAASQSPPPLSVCANAYAAVEDCALVWVSLDLPPTLGLGLPDGVRLDPPDDGRRLTGLRTFVFGASLANTLAQLPRYREFDPAFKDGGVVRSGDSLTFVAPRDDGGRVPPRLTMVAHPARADKTLVHAVLALDPGLSADEAFKWAGHHARAMGALRRALVHSGAVCYPPAESTAYVAAPTHAGSRTERSGRKLPVRVTSVYEAAADVRAFEIEPVEPFDVGALADFIPGAHIDVVTPVGFRQYSIVSQPGAINGSGGGRVAGLRIGVKREPRSRGGSAWMFGSVKAGDVLQVSRPKNHFRLANGRSAVLLAGGIGVTPLISMAVHMQAAERPCSLHYFARGPDHVAFRQDLDRLQQCVLHVGLTPVATVQELSAICHAVEDGTDLYVCGPRPFLDAALHNAEANHIGAERIHFELFSNTISHTGDKAFKVKLARSGETLTVPADKSLADVLKEHGCPVETSCEQGVCGTCMVRFLEGEPDHRDAYLSPEERKHCMQSCVSRSRSDLLVLDL